jgi:hypothetical protein
VGPVPLYMLVLSCEIHMKERETSRVRRSFVTRRRHIGLDYQVGICHDALVEHSRTQARCGIHSCPEGHQERLPWVFGRVTSISL